MRIEVQERDEPSAGAGEVVVKTRMAGICGGDLHRFRSDRSVRIVCHELAGVVTAVGADVESLVPGDRVVVEPLMSCRRCRFCQAGRPQLCPGRKGLGYELDGVCAELVTVPADHCYRIPDGMTWNQAVNVHGLAAPLQALSKLQYRLADSVLILGAGPQGLFFSQLARNCMGARKVIVAGRSRHRLDLAASLGADVVLETTAASILSQVLDSTGGEGADVVIDTTGDAGLLEQVVDMASKGGHVIPYAPGAAQVDFRTLLKKELTFYGTTGVTGNMTRAIEVISLGLVNVDRLMTHHFEIGETQRAFDLASGRDHQGYVKGAIVLSSD